MSASPPPPAASAAPPRAISGFGAFSVVAGSMLGIGIFLSPPVVAGAAGSPWLFGAVWLLGGLVALSGAVAYAELGAMMPHSGGDYVYLREAFGPSMAFAANQVLAIAVFGGSVAAVAAGIGAYQLPSLTGVPAETPLAALLGASAGPGWAWLTCDKAFALLIIFAITAVNHAGARMSALLQLATTVLPALLLIGGSLVALVLSPAATAGDGPGWSTDGDPLTAWLAVYFAYSGWNAASYIAGEIRTPERALHRALVGGTLAITALYLWLNVVFVHVLGPEGLRAAGEVGSTIASVVAGPRGSLVFAGLLVVLLCGSLNATVLGGARISRAASVDGAFWRFVAPLDRRTGTPARALWLQAAWASVLVATERFEQILQLASAAMVVTGSLSVLALFVLRRRRPAAPRPYHAFGYPFVPALYLLASAVVLGAIVWRAATNGEGGWLPVAGAALLAIAWVGHRLLVARPPRSPERA